jgi:hypothetical protein
MTIRETLVDALERWAQVQPDKLVWQFHNDKLEIEDTYTYKVISHTSVLSSGGVLLYYLLSYYIY